MTRVATSLWFASQAEEAALMRMAKIDGAALEAAFHAA